MQQRSNRCSKLVAERLECSVCKGLCKKHGKTANLKQRYQCTNCKKTFINLYTYNAYKRDTTEWIKNLLKEGSGVRSIGRLLLISNTTVLKRILALAKAITKPVTFLHKSYEVDEVCT